MSKAKRLVDEVLNRYYYEHHDAVELRKDLERELNGARVRGFMECKERVKDALIAKSEYLDEQHPYGTVESKIHKLTIDSVLTHVRGLLVWDVERD